MICETLGFPDVPGSPEPARRQASWRLQGGREPGEAQPEADAATNGGAVVPLQRRQQPEPEELDPGDGPDDDDPGPRAA